MENKIINEKQPIVDAEISEQPKPTEIKIQHGNIDILQLQLLNRIVENTNMIVKLLQEKK